MCMHLTARRPLLSPHLGRAALLAPVVPADQRRETLTRAPTLTRTQWYLRTNSERRDAQALEGERAAQQADGLLKLLPPEERALRRRIFVLEEP